MLRTRAVATLAWAALTGSLALAAHAEQAPEPTAPPERVRVSYALGADCPRPEAFEAELDARLGAGWKASPDELARTLALTERVEGGAHVVRMDFQDRTGRAISRTATAATCEEALRLMALITAVAIDAQTREPAPAPPDPEPAPAPACPVCPAAPICPAKPVVPAARSAPESPFVHEAGLRLALASGFGPAAALGVGAEWGLVSAARFGVRAAVEARNTGNVAASDGRARFWALTARAELCFVTLPLSSVVGIPVCGGLEAGVLGAEGVVSPPAVTFTSPSRVPWVAGLLAPRLRFASARAYLEVMPEVRLPLAGHTFLFTPPRRPAHEIPSLAYGAALAAGARFR